MEKCYKFRIYPNSEQQSLMQKTFGCCRYVYNHFLFYKLSTELVKKYDILCVEDLQVKNMVKNRCLAKPINDATVVVAQRIAW
ncbi:MAG: helix-turn-helix domain-containing protein [Treponema sp.]|jgi:transposase|nr:helix-turn-helix domain-containing protein [Treponema sp.]